MKKYTKKDMMDLIIGKLQRNFGRDVEDATSQQMFQACAMVIRDIISARQLESSSKIQEKHSRQVHYLSMEFLMGRSLRKNAYNLGLEKTLTEAVEALGFSAADLFEEEPDAGLGNGGLGRLAACYLDSMTTLEIPATGYSICYELGIFKQKIVDGKQVELADNWLSLGDAWLIPKMEEAEEVRRNLQATLSVFAPAREREEPPAAPVGDPFAEDALPAGGDMDDTRVLNLDDLQFGRNYVKD